MTPAEMPPTSEIDCVDNSCQFATSKGGMRTNGGCTCYEKAGFHRSAIRSAQMMLPEIRRLREALQESQARESRAREEGRERVRELENALNGILKNVALDWYVEQFAKDETPKGACSGVAARIHNIEVRQRAAKAFQEARAAASRSGEGE